MRTRRLAAGAQACHATQRQGTSFELPGAAAFLRAATCRLDDTLVHNSSDSNVLWSIFPGGESVPVLDIHIDIDINILLDHASG